MNNSFKKLLLPSLLMITACGAPFSNEDILFRLSIPTAEVLKLRVESQQSQQGLRTAQDMCPVETAETYLMVRDGARGINTSLLSVLGIVDVVTLYPPSERQDDFRRWGPWEDQEKAFQLEVYRTTTSSRSQYSYEMHGKRIGDSEWRVLLSGELLEGNTASAGRGKLFLDLDAISSIDPASQDKDRFSVDYDTRSNGLSFDLIIRSSSVSLSSAVTKQIRNEQFMSADILARYSYLETENGAGHFKIEGPTDVHKDSDPNLSQQEFLTISARWAADQKGRAETTIEGGDTEDALRASECWDDSFVLTYRDARFGAITDICGLVENCGAEFQSSDFLR